jgi:hypothetical protein
MKKEVTINRVLIHTLNVRIQLISEEAIMSIDQESYASYRSNNAKELGLKRTITINPEKLNKSLGKPFEKINSLEKLITILNLLQQDDRVDKIIELKRLDIAFDFDEAYTKIKKLNRVLLLSHNPKATDGKLETNDIFYFGSDSGRSLLDKSVSNFEIVFYNKESQMKYFYQKIWGKSRLEFRYQNLNANYNNWNNLKKNLKRLKKDLIQIDKGFHVFESKYINHFKKEYDKLNIKVFKNFVIKYHQYFLTKKSFDFIYNYSDVTNGNTNGYLKDVRKSLNEEFQARHLDFIYSSNLKQYTKDLRVALNEYIYGG